jgi:hypothetical protein
MSTALHRPSLAEEQSGFPVVHLSYECILHERSREAACAGYLGHLFRKEARYGGIYATSLSVLCVQ